MFSLGAQRLEVMGCPTCALSYPFGDDAEIQAAYPVLNHTLVPFLGHTVYLRLVDTLAKALAYAAGGFHTSVERGLGGGCHDPSFDFMQEHGLIDGVNVTPCVTPLGRDDIRSLWAKAAQNYLDAYNIGVTTRSLSKTKAAIVAAQSMAMSPYQLENVAPPRDPGPSASGLPEVTTMPGPQPAPAPSRGASGGVVIAAGAVFLAFTGVVTAVATAQARKGRIGI